MIVFQVALNFDPVKKKKKKENMISHLYFNEESNYSEENTYDNEVFRSTILQHRKKLNILTLQLLIYYIQFLNRKSRFVQMQTLQKRSERNRLSLL